MWTGYNLLWKCWYSRLDMHKVVVTFAQEVFALVYSLVGLHVHLSKGLLEGYGLFIKKYFESIIST